MTIASFFASIINHSKGNWPKCTHSEKDWNPVCTVQPVEPHSDGRCFTLILNHPYMSSGPKQFSTTVSDKTSYKSFEISVECLYPDAPFVALHVYTID